MMQNLKNNRIQFEGIDSYSCVFEAGIYIATFDQNENLTSFTFTDGTRKMLGYNGLDDFPNEFTSWEKTIIPEERESIVNLFWNTVKNHRQLPDISHAEYRMMKKDGSIIWVKRAEKLVRRDDGSISHIIYGCQDITEEKERELKALALSEKQSQTLYAIAGIFYSMHLINLKTDSIQIYNAKNEVKSIVVESTTTSARKLMHKVISSVTNVAYRKDALYFTDLTTIAERMKNKKILSSEFVGNRVGWFLASFIAIDVDKEGKPVEVLFTTRVIDKEKQREEKLLQESNTDQLTGLYNRRAYEDAIKECELLGLSDTFVYVSIDINGLKIANDTIGHNAGDELIIGASDCMRHCFKQHGNIYRTGGDEFSVLMEADDELLEEIKKNLSEACANWKGNLVEKLSLSCGFVTAREFPNLSLHEISVTADKRMYKAKSDYYRSQGIDRRGQQDAYKVLCALYTKILKINVTHDTYQIINMNATEQSVEKGFQDKISSWLVSFGKDSCVHSQDIDEYLRLSNLNYISSHFKKTKSPLRIFYRRKYEDNFKNVMMEIVPSSDYKDEDQNLFLFVKDIDPASNFVGTL